MMIDNYYFILNDDGSVTDVKDAVVWGKWFEENRRVCRIGLDKVKDGCGVIEVSTVFLGINHNFNKELYGNRPILFETMIFGGEHDGRQWRYASKKAAEIGHKKAVALVKGER